MEELTFDKKTLKVLSSEMRLKILKELESHQKTQTDLAEHLELTLPTVKEHLDLLEEEGLVKKEAERKWKYYSLTERGKTILNPETKMIKLLLYSLGGFVMATSIAYYFQTPAPQLEKVAIDQFAETALVSAQTSSLSLILILFFVLISVNLLFLIYFFIKRKGNIHKAAEKSL